MVKGRQDWVEKILKAGADADKDGLTDIEEIDKYKTDPLKFDTDGDQLGDGDEVKVFGTNPLMKSSGGGEKSDSYPIMETDGIQAMDKVAGTYPWYEVGKTLVAKWQGGGVLYGFNVPKAGVYRISLRICNFRSEIPDGYRFRVETKIDGAVAGVLNIFADNDVSGTGYLQTPMLQPGDHKLFFNWDNSVWKTDSVLRDPKFGVEKVSVLAINAPAWAKAEREKAGVATTAVAGASPRAATAKHKKQIEMAKLYESVCRYSDATDTIQDIMDEGPAPEVRSEAQALLEEIKAQASALEKATASLKKAADAAPDKAAAQVALAKVYAERKAYGEAMKYYIKAFLISQDMDTCVALGNLNRSAKQQNESIGALRSEIGKY